MNLREQVQRIEVYYDGRCGMCCSFHEWIHRQRRAFAVTFIPYQSPDAERIFPGIGLLDPAREMVVRTDDGDIFRGAEAWVWCLYSCEKYQAAALKLGSPAMLPVAVKACRLLAANRHALSKVFFRAKDRAVREQLHQMAGPDCGSELCTTEYPTKKPVR